MPFNTVTEVVDNDQGGMDVQAEVAMENTITTRKLNINQTLQVIHDKTNKEHISPKFIKVLTVQIFISQNQVISNFIMMYYEQINSRNCF